MPTGALPKLDPEERDHEDGRDEAVARPNAPADGALSKCPSEAFGLALDSFCVLIKGVAEIGQQLFSSWH